MIFDKIDCESMQHKTIDFISNIRKGMLLTMKIWQENIPFSPNNPLEYEFFTESTIFFDIETTGFSSARTQVYLIGCAYRINASICITQFFAEAPEEEPQILSAFWKLLSHYDTVITYNGLGFDVPYLKNRFACHNLSERFDSFRHLDIFRQLSKLKSILKLPDLKQKTLESFLGIEREDVYSGGDLIHIYSKYVSSPSEENCSLLKLHNYEDMTGMLKLLPALSYPKLFDGCFHILSCETNTYDTYEGVPCLEFILTLETDYPLPKRFSYKSDIIYLTGINQTVKLSVPVYQGELKYFYKDYKDYYYLPQEDIAIHKSIASYVDKDYRTKAKASNCYSKKSGCFLPQYKNLFSPCLKKDYHDKSRYFEMTDTFTDSLESLKTYAFHLIQNMTNQPSS